MIVSGLNRSGAVCVVRKKCFSKVLRGMFWVLLLTFVRDSSFFNIDSTCYAVAIFFTLGALFIFASSIFQTVIPEFSCTPHRDRIQSDHECQHRMEVSFIHVSTVSNHDTATHKYGMVIKVKRYNCRSGMIHASLGTNLISLTDDLSSSSMLLINEGYNELRGPHAQDTGPLGFLVVSLLSVRSSHIVRGDYEFFVPGRVT